MEWSSNFKALLCAEEHIQLTTLLAATDRAERSSHGCRKNFYTCFSVSITEGVRYTSLRGISVAAPRGTSLSDDEASDSPSTISAATNTGVGQRSKHKLSKSFLGFGLSKISEPILPKRHETLENINAAAANASVPGAGSEALEESDGDGGARPTARRSGPVSAGASTLEPTAAGDNVMPTVGPSAAEAGNANSISASGTSRNEEARKLFAGLQKMARLEAETNRILAEQKERDPARLLAELAAAEQTSAAHKPRGSHQQQQLYPLSYSSSTPSVDYNSRYNATSIDPRMAGESTGKLVVPLSEAPSSAINANNPERRVAVRCKQSTLDLPVEWETTTLDILFSAASCLSQMMNNLNPSSSLLVESFSGMGLERRLRRYEQIRDVMNSWDKDTHNTLIVIPQGSADDDQDLDISSVPRTSAAPNGFTLHLYHSQKPGKWTKRYVTLMETGQMYASKKPDFRTTDKDCHAICHLSDFDIYTPTESQMRRHLKPPKKFCYAIKSQQKTAVFLSMDSYVHYFCTEDPNMAQKFHALVHGWRSWYLVNRRVELAIKKKKAAAPQIAAVKSTPKKSLNVANVNGHRSKVSMDESPYAVGSLEPLVDLKRSEKPIEEFGRDFLPDQKNPQREAGPSTPRKTSNPAKPLLQPDGPEFKANGLLGDSYRARRGAEVGKQREAQLHDSPTNNVGFTGGDTLLSNMANSPKRSREEENKPEPRSWFPSATEHTATTRVPVQPKTALERSRSTSGGNSNHRPPPSLSGRFGAQTGLKPSPSVRGDGRGPVPGMPKPLVDLTPKFQEAPQWRNKGHGVQAPAGVHLVDLISSGQPQGANKFLDVPPRDIPRRDTSSSSTASIGHQPQEREARPMHRPAPSAGRQRSRSVATSAQGGGARRPVDGRPLVPPLPLRAREIEVRRSSGREDTNGGDRRRRDDLGHTKGRSGTLRSS
ncbi:hypothetical protein MKZ38_010661 [Zalerion maritima]|uniref:PH domain-containing protein n=1 Tax=Zalerion maritima TaxID=339359 RepID=A0AAD5S0A9_9PEZI|nr:hypothetical protein MKZ38_010661 [Zalerion maritima]